MSAPHPDVATLLRKIDALKADVASLEQQLRERAADLHEADQTIRNLRGALRQFRTAAPN